MNASEIIKNIETAQLKAEVPEFRVGDTVRYTARSKRVTVRESRYSRVLYLKNRAEATVRHLL